MKSTKTLEVTDQDLRIVISWADAAGIGFTYGGEPDPNDPSEMILHKLINLQDDQKGSN